MNDARRTKSEQVPSEAIADGGLAIHHTDYAWLHPKGLSIRGDQAEDVAYTVLKGLYEKGWRLVRP